jgi:hypothetical protein
MKRYTKDEIRGLLKIMKVLQRWGPGSPLSASLAEEWLENGFGPAQVEEWLTVGVTYPHKASLLVSQGVFGRDLDYPTGSAFDDGDMGLGEVISRVGR